MRLNHPDYIKLVTEAYKKKRTGNQLSPLLAQSTPGNIRLECANVYQERYAKKDEPALRAFFGPAEHGKKFLAAIQGFHINKFKSLDQFLKGDGKKGINDRNLNLLAWLIDFEHRPYTFGMEVRLDKEEQMIIEEPVNSAQENNWESNLGRSDSEEGIEEAEIQIDDVKKAFPQESGEDPVIYSKKPEILLFTDTSGNKQKNTFKKAVIIFLALAAASAGIFIIHKYDSSGKIPDSNLVTAAPEDTIAGQKIDSLVPVKKNNLALSAGTNKRKPGPGPIVLDSSHCLAITKKGTQCKRKPTNNGYCWQHSK